MNTRNQQIEILNFLLEKCVENYYRKAESDEKWRWEIPKDFTRQKELKLFNKSVNIIKKQGFRVIWDNGESLMLIYRNPIYLAFVAYNKRGELIPRIKEADYIILTEGFFCMNCGEELLLCEKNNFSAKCGECGWRTELVESFREKPMGVFYDKYGLCYPPITENNLTHLPDKLKIAVINYFKKGPYNLSKKEYDLIYHSLFRQDIEKLKDLETKYKQKRQLTEFFQTYNTKNFRNVGI